MKISIVQGAFFPVPPILGGAVEKTWLVLGQEFAKAGHAVTHISRSHPSLPATEEIGGVRHVRVRGFEAPRNGLWMKALDLIYSLRAVRVLPAADILVTHTFWLPMVARDRQKGRVYVHVARVPKGQMRLYRRAARLQGISTAVADSIRMEVPRSAHTRVTSIPLPLPWNVEDSLEVKSRTVLYVGRIHSEKGLHLLIEAFARLNGAGNGWSLRIVGSAEFRHGGGGEAYLRELQERAAELGVPVEWQGPVFGEEALREEYARAAIFVYPSVAEKGETFGLAPLEAMSGGCAPIVSDLACFREFLRPQENGLVFDHRAADRVEQLASQLRNLITDEALRSRLAAGGVETAREFTADRVAQLYLNDFRAVMGEKAES